MEDDNEAKHWFVRRQPRPLNQTYVDQVDEVFRNRWRTLLSVDDLVDDVFTKLTDDKLLENTIALYTSDHGYHLGNYGLPLDKRMPYDTGMIIQNYAPKSKSFQEAKYFIVIFIYLQ